jgi:hypothetical protein
VSYAAVTYVNLEGRDPAASQKALEEGLIPLIKTLPGFRAARFLHSLDGKSGVGAVIFDTEANAKAGLDSITNNRPPEAPPIESSALYEVISEV